MIESASSRTASQLWFNGPLSTELREIPMPAPGPEQLLVRTLYSAVSAGSELLVYRGELPDAMALDSTLESFQGEVGYPVQYGYACVGEVQEVGSAVAPHWLGRQVFSFQPHASHFLAAAHELISIPEDLSPRSAVFLPNMETAVNLIHDGRPLLGERVVVLGQGVVGLLLAALLREFPLALMVAIDKKPFRREMGRRLGLQCVCSPEEVRDKGMIERLREIDLVYEVSGHPDALDLAVQLSAYSSRIVVGSWYGNKPSTLHLGGEAHRNRVQIATSQVSTIAPQLSGRWDKARRFEVAWEMIRRIEPERLITHTATLSEAESYYQRLHGEDPEIVQLVFEYVP